VAAAVADDVDRRARFPVESLDAMRAEGLLSILVPASLGGKGAGILETAKVVAALGQHCASTAMICAMHQIQVACLVRHGHNDHLRAFKEDLVTRQPLLASATTEVGVGGDVRTSVCALERENGRFRLEKQAPVISYGEQADGVLATARRTTNSPPNDQALVLCTPPNLSLKRVSDWDTLGFRGTCSPGFVLEASGDEACVLDDPFDEIASHTMVPVAHVLWSAVWLGIASAAVERASAFVRAEARKKPGTTPPAALRLAEVSALHQQMVELVFGTARHYDEVSQDPETLEGMGFAIAVNGLKVSASTMVVEVVGRAMAVCGMAGYREDSPYSMGRLIRDAYGAALMVNNDRIIANNAQMLLVHKDA
jgi:acyl-CoA dehydrogenase